MIQRCFCSKAEGGSRGTFSVRTQGVANGLSHVVYRPGLIVRGVFSIQQWRRVYESGVRGTAQGGR